ncbi:hypothetical protein CC77DRAFT_688349 [Alternaria alternata]|uniref:Uncharacterized protein n=1 Tax=Alternaria alternata TaxID=5599 RepID=A0A177DW76_ALTAL|nr:hypothetical protein CC77DRAFT_688349 [Alternaria alternata]OAG23059.1 hypothetical protein CC77DRAFT_688349 [Alternaria alternata]CAI9636587.1 unnamed protein product [Alternaria burnsii]
MPCSPLDTCSPRFIAATDRALLLAALPSTTYARVSTPFDGERNPTRAEPPGLRPFVTLLRHSICSSKVGTRALCRGHDRHPSIARTRSFVDVHAR